jgi:uncharacterized protein
LEKRMRIYYLLGLLFFLSPTYANPLEETAPAQYEEAMRQAQALERDDAAVLSGLQSAAAHGYAPAMYALGWVYSDGRGVAKDEAIAFSWFQQAAEAGLATAQHMLGVCYAQGRGVDRDQEKALYWFQHAARNGDSAARAMLERLLGKPAAAILLDVAPTQ